MKTQWSYLFVSLSAALPLSLAACGDDSDGKGSGPRLSLQTIQSATAGTDNNPEIVRMVPGTSNKVVFIESSVNKLGSLTYTDTSIEIGQLTSVPASAFDSGQLYSELSSITVDPNGEYVAIVRVDTRCPTANDSGAPYVRGSVMFVDIDPPHTVLADIEVGYAPDSVHISNDGNWAVVANEADPERSGEDANSCNAPNQGSVSIIDLSAGVANAEVVQELDDFTPDTQLPEGVKISPDNDTVVIAFQTSSELGIFHLSDVPSATITMVGLPSDSGPDGLSIAPDGSFVLASNEDGDSFSIVTLPDGDVLTTYSIRDAGDVPERYNRDARDSTRIHEPEECAVFEMAGSLYAVLALQESHAVIGYSLKDLQNPVFEDITEVGIDWQAEANGRESSDIGPEGLSFKDGFIAVANEREGSLSLVKATVE